MPFPENNLQGPRPDRLADVELPRRKQYTPSPVDWRNEVIYFLLVDRFSDGRESSRPLLDRNNLAGARGADWNWNAWVESGAGRWQGGNLQGIASKLDYLSELGVTTIWLSPVFQQRPHADSYHGYGIQDFLEVDPHFGTREDLVNLVAAAHDRGMRVILDIIFNHSGPNWLYPGDEWMPPYLPYPLRYQFGRWVDAAGNPIDSIDRPTDGVFPEELQSPEYYTRAGMGDLGAGDPDDPNAEHKRTDFFILRDFDLDRPGVLNDLAKCYKYWIALTDCDGFRIDTMKHVSLEHGRNFCGAVKEFAANIGKENFFLIGEVAGGDYIQDHYLDALTRNLDAVLDIGNARPNLVNLAKGLAHPDVYFNGFEEMDPSMGSHRNIGNKHVAILDDHDHVFGEKLRFSANAVNDHQVIAGVAIQLFTLGVPCIYYGTEQALAGPEPEQRQWLPNWGGADFYLREALFGPEHPRKAGIESNRPDPDIPGFGPFGTAGHHCFDQDNPAYRRISRMTKLRQAFPVLRRGRQYLRPVSFLGKPFAVYGGGEILAWSRILDDEEALCVVNVHGLENRGARVLVDGKLSGSMGRMIVALNTMDLTEKGSAYPEGTAVPVEFTPDGTAFVDLRDIGPSEFLVLANR